MTHQHAFVNLWFTISVSLITVGGNLKGIFENRPDKELVSFHIAPDSLPSQARVKRRILVDQDVTLDSIEYGNFNLGRP